MEGARKRKCICRRSHRLRRAFLYSLLLILFLFIGLSPSLYAQTLDINFPIEQRFYKGSPEQVEDFIERCELHVKQIVSELNLIPKESLSMEDRKALLEALDLFGGLSFQFMRLKREIKAPSSYPLISLPGIGNPPYKLQDLDRYLSIYHQLIQKLKEYQNQLKAISVDLSEMQQQLKQIYLMYLDLKRDTAKKIKAQALLAQLISLQVEYALKVVKKYRLSNTIKMLSPRANGCKARIADIFGNLGIDAQDIRLLTTRQKKIAKEEDALRKEILSKQKALNKKIILFELRLDTIVNKLGSSQILETGKRLLKVEKERIEAYLDRFQYQKEMLNQQRIDIRLNRLYLDFRYDWMANYSRYSGYKKTGLLIREWSKRLKGVEDEAEQLKEKLDHIRDALSFLNERIIRIGKEMQTETDQQVKDSLKSLYNALSSNRHYLNKLIDQLSKNLSHAANVAWNIKSILSLMENRVGRFERMSYKIKENIQGIWLHIKGIIYYPLWSMGGNVITMVTILKIIFFLCLGIYLLRFARKRLSKLLIERVGLSIGLVNSISTLSYYFMLLLVIFIALSTAGVNLSQITIILGALGVGIGFGLQTIANNFISGLILLTERTIKVGDIVELENDLMGRVKDVSIRSTVIRTYDGLDIIVPNSDFIANKVTTWTYGDDWRRLRIPFGVSYGSDPDRVAEIAKEVAKQIPITIEDAKHHVSVWFEGFGDSSLDFSLLVWCRMRELKPVSGLISDYYFALFRRFKQEGIEIPFPQRDLHIRSISESISESITHSFKKNKKEGGRDEI